ncbi:MAG: SPOR domain-containing protein [Proteobacteria bacterium]|nr:SPOR domain-containing protein [Cystobacterineae bacterium]MCL2259632.1 SPOR domain-containing protein [Cystobacterineae bacterium]MCL2313844.1 SPOR domain-containing protein [Pseudomonadota bacterium]
MRENTKRVSKPPMVGKHVLSFAFLGLLLSGATFVLGLNTGRRMAQAQVVACEDNPLIESDKKTEALAQIQIQQEQAAPLTFQEELLKPIPIALPKPLKERPKPPEVSAPLKEATKLAEVSALKETTKLAEVSVLAATGGLVRQASLKDAFVEFQKESREVSKPVGLKEWALQVSSHREQEDAERVVAKLSDRGYMAYVVSTELGERGTWYRVRMGQFGSRQEAERVADKLVDDMRMSAPLVVSLK